MFTLDRIVKTAAGFEEVRLRSQGIAPRLRALLITVDGTQSVDEFRGVAVALGAPENSLEDLLDKGLIARAPSQDRSPQAELAGLQDAPAPVAARRDEQERFHQAQAFVLQCVHDLLGVRSLLWRVRVERCRHLQDLRLLLPVLIQAIERVQGSQMAQALREQSKVFGLS